MSNEFNDEPIRRSFDAARRVDAESLPAFEELAVAPVKTPTSRWRRVAIGATATALLSVLAVAALWMIDDTPGRAPIVTAEAGYVTPLVDAPVGVESNETVIERKRRAVASASSESAPLQSLGYVAGPIPSAPADPSPNMPVPAPPPTLDDAALQERVYSKVAEVLQQSPHQQPVMPPLDEPDGQPRDVMRAPKPEPVPVDIALAVPNEDPGKGPAPADPAKPLRSTGSLSVEIMNADGTKLPGAVVKISNKNGLIQDEAVVSGRDGTARFPVLPKGEGYVAEASFPGLATRREENLSIGTGDDKTTAIQLSEENVERVTVVATAPVVDLEDSSSTTTFDGEFVGDLPAAGRFYQNVLTLDPGVNDPGGDGNPVVHGSRDRNFQANVPGATQRAEGTPPVPRQPMPRPSPVMQRPRLRAPLTIENDVRPQPNPIAVEPISTERYDVIEENDFKRVGDAPLSTFSIDVDTASYANVRRHLQQGKLPPSGAVRLEELINYFEYNDPAPSRSEPFSVTTELGDAPWAAEHKLLRIGLKGREVERGESAGTNLVFLIDVSGSMSSANKLPLLQKAFGLLVDQLEPSDRVAMVVYAGSSGLVLDSTTNKADILEALGRLRAGGSTNGGSGIDLAYRVARENFIEGGVNRVILATDGDFNVGQTDKSSLLDRIQQDAKDGVFLTALGFGMGNLNDSMLETLADKGNGNYAYIDSLREAQKVLVEELGGTLVTIAKDVKIQVEFNPAEVAGYRLIGYENRKLAAQDFNDDKKDAGEIGAGHSITALYEIVPAGVEVPRPAVDPLKYQQPSDEPTARGRSREWLTVKLRYKEPDGDTSKLIEVPFKPRRRATVSTDLEWASCVAAFGMLLRDSSFIGDMTLDDVERIAERSRGADTGGYRAEFIRLIGEAKQLR